MIAKTAIIYPNVRLGNNVIIEDYCIIGVPYVKNELSGPIIEEYAKIGANSTILPGITVGKNALVGAGSVVTKDVPDGWIVSGNPAKVMKKIHY